MKKAFPLILMVLGLVFVAASVYTVGRGVAARNQVESELVAQRITTPEDASIPNAEVRDVATAQSMADIINAHALKSTNGLTYAEMGKFATADGNPKGTNDAAAAVKSADGKPVPNSARTTALNAASLRTSLYSSVMAFEVSTLVMGLGALIGVLGFAIGGVGVALAGLSLPSFARRVHVQPVASA